MNHGDKSPVGQGNDSARSARKCDGSVGSYQDDDERQTNNYKYLVADDLQKLRNSSHHGGAQAMDQDDSEHDAIIKGLLYPAIQNDNDSDGADFFEEDYQIAQAAVNNSVTAVASAINDRDNENRRDSQRRDSQRSRYRLGHDYPDLVGEKLRR
eukprot:scaffold22593_cov145-Cylindrotheca_fusiformis.AAC.9